MKIILFNLFIFTGIAALSQSYSNDGNEKDRHFFYEVKQIDEFVERFNNENNSYIRRIYKKKHQPFSISRSALIKSLFAYESKQWSTSLQERFIMDVASKQKPKLITLHDEGVYAKVSCKFQYYKQVIELPLILKLEHAPNGGYKWIITSVNTLNLKKEQRFSAYYYRNTGLKFINPASEETDFEGLEKVFDDKANLTDYFSSTLLKSENFKIFSSCVTSGCLKFMYVQNIRYYFFNISNWYFIVEKFDNNTLNTGWLISELKNINNIQKRNMLDSLSF